MTNTCSKFKFNCLFPKLNRDLSPLVCRILTEPFLESLDVVLNNLLILLETKKTCVAKRWVVALKQQSI